MRLFRKGISMRNALVIGNWKMNGETAANHALVASLVESLEVSPVGGVEVGICPPAVYLHSVGLQLEGSAVSLGAQNLSEHDAGAYTGEVSAAMLRDVGCNMVIVGHSERRSLYHENDQQVSAKTLAALRAGLKPVLCVGETLAQRESGEALDVVARQLCAAVSGIEADEFERLVVAYEPVWAIGTGKTASPEQAQEVHAHIRAVLARVAGAAGQNVQVLYGGSVNAANAAELFAKPDIDGGLIGGASLKANDFIAICRAAAVAG
ncbi:triosephosphate isomerase [Marinobacterium sp. MBR-109]